MRCTPASRAALPKLRGGTLVALLEAASALGHGVHQVVGHLDAPQRRRQTRVVEHVASAHLDLPHLRPASRPGSRARQITSMARREQPRHEPSADVAGRAGRPECSSHCAPAGRSGRDGPPPQPTPPQPRYPQMASTRAVWHVAAKVPRSPSRAIVSSPALIGERPADRGHAAGGRAARRVTCPSVHVESSLVSAGDAHEHAGGAQVDGSGQRRAEGAR